MPLTLQQINAAPPAEFTALLDGTEHSPGSPGRRALRPLPAWPALKRRAGRGGARSGLDAQLGLIRPPQARRQGHGRQTLTAESTHEQGKAGLTDCTPEFAQIQRLNADYNASSASPSSWRCGSRGLELDKARIIATFAAAWTTWWTSSWPSACNIHRIAEIRLNDKFGASSLGNRSGLVREARPSQRPRMARELTVTLSDRCAPLRPKRSRTG